jgi:hypothetical protein
VVSSATALRAAAGDLSRFRDLAERVDILLDRQLTRWTPGTGHWLVLPLVRQPPGFYLVSADAEGQRQGREVLEAFLGPSFATLESVEPDPDGCPADAALKSAGLERLSFIRRLAVEPGPMLGRIESLVSVRMDRGEIHTRPLLHSFVDLLRDFRLALLRRDGAQAESLLSALRDSGRLSRDNLRFLEIEKLGKLERWRELAELVYLPELWHARRPRAVNELLLDMLWYTELGDRSRPVPSDIGSRFGALLGSVDVPSTRYGRAAVVVSTAAQQDDGRLQRILAAAGDDAEREWLRTLTPVPGTAVSVADDSVVHLYARGRYSAAVTAFLRSPSAEAVDAAVESVLNSEDSARAGQVLAHARAFLASGDVKPHRRLNRDLDDLKSLAGNTVDGWLDWARRLARPERWPEAERTLRSASGDWPDAGRLSADEAQTLSIALFDGCTGVNQDQARLALDLLCRAATTTVGTAAGTIADAVLTVLSEQDNLSGPVRDAYLDLLESLVGTGPTAKDYREWVEAAGALWQKIAAPSAADWGIALVDMLQEASAPDDGVRRTVATQVVVRTQEFRHRLSSRQDTEIVLLATELGLSVKARPADAPAEDDVWSRLDGKLVGVYSLLPLAAERVKERLHRLAKPSGVVGNADHVATAALRSFAARADFLVVDTWHAAHAATGAIDEVRPRSRQILPRGRGVTGFVQAIEEALRSDGGVP